MVRNRALRILNNMAAAEDVAQDVFIKFMEHRNKGGTEREIAAFLYRIATNLALNKLRNTTKRSQLLQRNKQSSEVRDQIENKIAIETVLTKVTEEEACIATYYYVDGMEQEEIGNLLSMNRRTVGRRLEKFRDKAKKIIGTDLMEAK